MGGQGSARSATRRVTAKASASTWLGRQSRGSTRREGELDRRRRTRWLGVQTTVYGFAGNRAHPEGSRPPRAARGLEAKVHQHVNLRMLERPTSRGTPRSARHNRWRPRHSDGPTIAGTGAGGGPAFEPFHRPRRTLLAASGRSLGGRKPPDQTRKARRPRASRATADPGPPQPAAPSRARREIGSDRPQERLSSLSNIGSPGAR